MLFSLQTAAQAFYQGELKKAHGRFFNRLCLFTSPLSPPSFFFLVFFVLFFFLTVAHPLGTNLYPLSLPSLLFPLKSKMTAIIFSKKILRTRWPKLRCSAEQIQSRFHFFMAASILYFINSLINSKVWVLEIPEFS